jgi:hypothetical protein
MEKNILLEIHRMNELMGIKRKPLIMEQGFFGAAVRMFIKKGLTFDQALDDAAELLVSSGKIGRKEADDAVRLLKSEKSLVDDINKTYKNSKLSATLNDDLRIAAKIDDLIKKSGSTNLDDFIKGIKLVTQKEVDFITSELVKTMIKDGKFAQADDIFLNIFNPDIKTILREKLQNSKSKLNLSDFVNSYETASKTLTEIYIDYFKEYLKGKLDIGKLSKVDYDKTLLTIDKEFGEPVMQFLKDKHKYTNDSEIMSIIDEYRVAGRLDEGPGTITKPIYGKNNVADNIAEFRTDGKGKSFFRDKDINTQTNVVDGGVDIEFDIPANVSNVITTTEKRYPGFFAKYISNYTTDTLYNILRSYFGARSSSAFYKKVEEINNTLVNDFLPKFTSQLDTINKDGIEGFAQLDTFTTTVRQLLLDLKLSKSNIETWDDVWSKIKIDIKQKASATGLNDSVDSFITQIEKGGNSKNNIETFISTMNEVSKNPKLFPVNGERFALSSKEAIYDWLRISEFFKESSESINKLKLAYKSNIVVDFLPQLLKETWNWFSGFLLYQAPRTIQRILKDINYGGITNGNIIKTAFSTYLAMMFTSFFFSPIYDSFRKYADTVLGAPIESLFEWIGFLDPNRKEEYDPTSGKSGFDVLVEGYKNKFKQTMEADLNLDDVVVVGKGPIIEATMSLIEKYTKSPEEVEQEYLESQNEILNEKISKRLQSNAKKNEDIWLEADNRQKDEIKKKNGWNNIERILRNYTNSMLKAKNPNFVPLTYDQYKKIKNSLVFIPGLDESMSAKLTQSTVEEKEKWIQDELAKTTKKVDFAHQVNDVMGYIAIKARDGKHYKVVQRDLWLHYITPSMEEITVDPNVKQTQNDLNTILDKL